MNPAHDRERFPHERLQSRIVPPASSLEDLLGYTLTGAIAVISDASLEAAIFPQSEYSTSIGSCQMRTDFSRILVDAEGLRFVKGKDHATKRGT